MNVLRWTKGAAPSSSSSAKAKSKKKRQQGADPVRRPPNKRAKRAPAAAVAAVKTLDAFLSKSDTPDMAQHRRVAPVRKKNRHVARKPHASQVEAFVLDAIQNRGLLLDEAAGMAAAVIRRWGYKSAETEWAVLCRLENRDSRESWSKSRDLLADRHPLTATEHCAVAEVLRALQETTRRRTGGDDPASPSRRKKKPKKKKRGASKDDDEDGFDVVDGQVKDREGMYERKLMAALKAYAKDPNGSGDGMPAPCRVHLITLLCSGVVADGGWTADDANYVPTLQNVLFALAEHYCSESDPFIVEALAKAASVMISPKAYALHETMFGLLRRGVADECSSTAEYDAVVGMLQPCLMKVRLLAAMHSDATGKPAPDPNRLRSDPVKEVNALLGPPERSKATGRTERLERELRECASCCDLEQKGIRKFIKNFL